MKEPHDIVAAMSLPGAEHSAFSLARPIALAERELRLWRPVLLVLQNGQRVIVRPKECWT